MKKVAAVDRLGRLDRHNLCRADTGPICNYDLVEIRTQFGEDVTADNEAGFMTGLEQRALAKVAASRVSPFNYWRARVYRAVRAMNHGSCEALRLAIQQSAPSVQAMENLFFN